MVWLQTSAVFLFLPSRWVTAFLGFGRFGVKNKGKPQRAQEHSVIRHQQVLACPFPSRGLLGGVFILASLGGKQ